MGGAQSLGGMTSGGTSAGGVSGASGGAAGASAKGGAGGTAGAVTGGSSAGWTCPTGLTGKPTLTSATPTRVASVPPSDSFNQNNGTFGNIEGPVWIGDALYITEMGAMSYDSTNSNVKMSRILKVTSDGMTSIAIADSGSNGLAVDANGNIVAAVHKDGSITRFTLPSGTPTTTLVSKYMGNRFDSPNDLAIRSDGNIYFSDPDFQAPNTHPQSATRVYRLDPAGAVTAISDNLSNPNGVTLSLAEDWLYVAAGTGRKYPVMSDGSLGTGQDFAPATSGDGMVLDCAGNLYVAKTNSSNVAVYGTDGNMIGTITVPSSNIQAVTNVAFGGADHKTLYITGLGNNKGLFQVKLDIPGRPY